MSENGLKVSKFVSLFHLEVLNKGSDYDEAMLTVPDLNRPGLQFQSFYDYFDPRRLQVVGKAEITFLKGLTSAQRRKCFDDLFLYDIPALVIARDLDCFPECIESARVHEKTLLRTNEVTVVFSNRTSEYLGRFLAPCVTRHGVMLDVYGEGVMITGDSGVGKSEAAIELIMRGHRLVADDGNSRHTGAHCDHTCPAWAQSGQYCGGGGHEQPAQKVWVQCRPGACQQSGPAGGRLAVRGRNRDVYWY